MRITTRTVGDVTILDLDGRLVAGVGDEALREAMEPLLERECPAILVNFTDVVSMDSSGIGELVSAWKRVRQQGHRLAILRPGDRVRHTLHLSQILPLLEVFEDESEAVGALGGTPEGTVS